jgi:hypothetical protein
MGRKRKGGIPGLSFSWKRALGVSAAKQRLSRKIGFPLTASGRRQKIGRAAGCALPLVCFIAGTLASVLWIKGAI